VQPIVFTSCHAGIVWRGDDTWVLDCRRDLL
jgi:hypothetical protein